MTGLSDKQAAVPHRYERDRSAIHVCTRGRAYDHPTHDRHRPYEARSER